MKYIRQFCIILGFSLLGEVLHRLIPFSIPASIYGLVFLFLALLTGLLKLEKIKETGGFLTSMLSLLFVSPVVNLLDCWDRVASNLVPILLIVVVSTLLTFGISGSVAQALLKRRKEAKDE